MKQFSLFTTIIVLTTIGYAQAQSYQNTETGGRMVSHFVSYPEIVY